MVLPFGFTGSPYAFVKVGRNILKKWRAVGPGEWSKRFGACMDASMRAGSKAMLYIDDTLGAHEHFVGAIWQRNAQMLELEKLGFSLSSKGELLPLPSVKFLGMLIHLGRKVPSWHVPKDKLDNIRRVADCRRLGPPHCPLRSVPLTSRPRRSAERVRFPCPRREVRPRAPPPLVLVQPRLRALLLCPYCHHRLLGCRRHLPTASSLPSPSVVESSTAAARRTDPPA